MSMNDRSRNFIGLVALLLPFSSLLGLSAGPVKAASMSEFNSDAFGPDVADASVSPDGSQVIYQKKTPHGWRIYISRRDGSNAKAVTSGPGADVEPSWRPDGALFAFASNRKGHWNIYAAHPDGSSVRAITSGTQDARDPQWSPRPFELPYKKDPLVQTVAHRKTSDVAPSDMQMLQKLSDQDSDWNGYVDEFSTFQAARYYKLLFVQGSGDDRHIATVREDGRQLMELSLNLKGPELEPRWDRTNSSIGFVVRHGIKSLVYTADYPLTHDLNDGEGTIKFGIDQDALRKSIKPIVVVIGAAQIEWSPSGEYLAVASGDRLRLIPRQGLALRAIAMPIDATADYGFSWMNDARTVLLTVQGNPGTRLKAETCESPLIDVDNIMDFSSLTPQDRNYLTRNSFVASGVPGKQMYDGYEQTDYSNLPSFITTDSLLHLHHLVFDSLLRDVEANHMTPDTISLVDHYLRASIDQAKTSTDSGIASSATANAAFFAVAARLIMGEVNTGITADEPLDPNDPLAADRAAVNKKQKAKDIAQLNLWTAPLKKDLTNLPSDAGSLADQEISLISSHSGPASSPIFPGTASEIGAPGAIIDTRLDYSDFIPRGHYTTSEVLRRYFLMSHWLRAGSFRRTPEFTQRALLLLAASDPDTLAKWRKVEQTSADFAGAAEDQDLASYASIAHDVYGGLPGVSDLSDQAKSADFLARVSALPLPKIAPTAGPSFRFLPAPSTPDAIILQSLVYDGNPPDVGTDLVPRYFALGLDVMGILGSDRAHDILSTTKFQSSLMDSHLNETEYANYDAVYQSLRSQYSSWTDADWSRSLYARTLYALLPLLDGQNKQPYAFASSPAWTDKNLNTALGTWAELKHDVLAKQPVATEAGGEGGITESVVPVQPVGFVEPAPEVYRRLALLVDSERSTLEGEGYLTEANKERVDTMAGLITMVQSLQKKQANGQPLNPREVEQLRFYGAYQEHLTLITTTSGEQGSVEGSDMAIVADVSTALSRVLNEALVLEEGVGRALPIYVIVPHNGHQQLACGSLFTYYEFTHPEDDRLTDEAWRQLLDSKDAPKTPAWTKSYVAHIDSSLVGN